MNIFYDNTIFSIQRYGGVSRYFSEITNRIVRYNDMTVHILKATNILPRKFFGLNRIFIDYKLATYGYEIYHPTYYSESVKKRKGVKTVVTVFDMIHELYLSKDNAHGPSIKVKKNSILNADHIICISRNTKKDLQEIYKIKEEKISVVYLASSLNDDNPEEPGYAKLDKPYFLYVGKRGSYKNFKVVLNAFCSLGLKKDFDIVCFGGGKFSEEEHREFKRLKVDDCLRHIEGPDGLLRFYYKNAYLFIYPSLYEGFGLPVLEAMNNDCPVIVSNAGSIPEIAGDAAMFFDPDKEEELSLCIKRMINDGNMRGSYITKGRERVKLFSWNKTAMETYNVYKKVLDK